MCRPSLQPHGLLWLKHDGMRLLCRSWFASSSHAFPHISALHIWLQHSTAERRDECCRGSFATWRPGLAEGLGRPCLWQSHCLKLQEISWATAAARRWYGSFPKFTAGLQSGSSGCVCLFLQNGAEQEVVTGNVCSVVLLEVHGGWGQRLGSSGDAPTHRQSPFKRFSLPPKSLQSGMP